MRHMSCPPDIGHPVHQNLFIQLSTRTNGVVSKRKFIGRSLGLGEHVIDALEIYHQKDCTEACYQMFRKWEEIQGKEATLTKLVGTLKRLNLGDAVKVVKAAMAKTA